MTRREFIEDVTNFDELIDFCAGNDCSICDGITDRYGLDDKVDDWLRDVVGERSWQDIYDVLDNIDTDGDWYDEDFEPLDDDDFDSYKSDVLDWVDGWGGWDDDEEEEPDEPEKQDEELYTAPISRDEFLELCCLSVQCIASPSSRDPASIPKVIK